jgi:hypothetical protein
MTPTRRDVVLIDGRTAAPVRVPAVLIRDLPPDRLKESEDLWGPERGTVQEALARLGVDMEHGHWDWRNKIERAVKGELLLSGLECEGELQGLIAVAARPRYAALLPGSEALYVDYIESAPWNLKATGTPKYKGVGAVLLADAIRRSQELGHGGRIGLHSLDSAADWYRGRGMTDLGKDYIYYDLRYFEYTSGAATAWLTSLEVSK